MTPEQDDALKRLMVAAQAGDQAAYETLLKEVAQLVRRFVQSRAPGASYSEDVVQESLLTVHRGRHTYDPSRALGPWLYAIAEYRLVDAFRREGRVTRRVVADEELLASIPDTSPAAQPDGGSRADLAEALRAAFDELPAAQRQVIELMKIEGLSAREVAGATGLSEANVRVIAHRGYKKLRERLAGWLSILGLLP